MADFPTAAVTRLGSYNGARYDATTNPLGFAIGGHRVNFPQALNDSASVAAYTAATASEVRANAQAVAEDVLEVAAALALSQRWATDPEDQQVLPGLFSALHHARKAAASAAAAATFEPANFVSKANDLELLFGRKIVRSRIDYGPTPVSGTWEFAPLRIEAYIGPNGEGAGSGVSLAFVDHRAGQVLHFGMGPDGRLYANGVAATTSTALTAAIENVAAVLRNEAQGKFDKAGGVISGLTRVTSGPGTGNIGFFPGDTRYTGYLDFILPNGTRAGYIGKVDSGGNKPIPMAAENGNWWALTGGRPTWNGDAIVIVPDLVFSNIGGVVQPNRQLLRPDSANGIGSFCAAVWAGNAGLVQGIGNSVPGFELDDPAAPGNRFFSGTWRAMGYIGDMAGRKTHLWQRYA